MWKQVQPFNSTENTLINLDNISYMRQRNGPEFVEIHFTSGEKLDVAGTVEGISNSPALLKGD